MRSHIAGVLPITADNLIAISAVTAVAPDTIRETVEGTIAKARASSLMPMLRSFMLSKMISPACGGYGY